MHNFNGVFNKVLSINLIIPILNYFIDLLFYNTDNDQLAQSSTYCLENLITSNGSKFDKVNWDCTCQTIVSMFDSMMPKPLQEQNLQSEVHILNVFNYENCVNAFLIIIYLLAC